MFSLTAWETSRWAFRNIRGISNFVISFFFDSMSTHILFLKDNLIPCTHTSLLEQAAKSVKFVQVRNMQKSKLNEECHIYISFSKCTKSCLKETSCSFRVFCWQCCKGNTNVDNWVSDAFLLQTLLNCYEESCQNRLPRSLCEQQQERAQVLAHLTSTQFTSWPNTTRH